MVRPWVYEALALALRESKASQEEIERAETSVADLEPLDARGFLNASASLAENKHYDAALAFSRQAAMLEPNVPFAYEDALRYAKELKDTGAMEWAAGNLMKRDWPQNNDDLHAKAMEELKRLASQLDPSNKDAAERLRAALERQRERDFVIRLSWAGKADLDLKVEEPSGSTCSWMNRQTVGGGILIGDTLPGKKQANENSETYIASQAFTGEYRISVDTVWGKPLGNKAKLEIIQHQGTPQETSRLVTVNFAEGNTVTVKLADGRRTEAAAVPPQASAKRPASPADAPASTDQVLSQLRALTDPGDSSAGIQGSAFCLGVPTTPPTIKVKPDQQKTQEQVTYQTRVAPFVNNSIDLTAQATVSADRRYVRLSMTPMFNVVTGTQLQSFVNNPLLPGGRR
jgi:tetratricopeptide (TPR) repeat protein